MGGEACLSKSTVPGIATKRPRALGREKRAETRFSDIRSAKPTAADRPRGEPSPDIRVPGIETETLRETRTFSRNSFLRLLALSRRPLVETYREQAPEGTEPPRRPTPRGKGKDTRIVRRRGYRPPSSEGIPAGTPRRFPTGSPPVKSAARSGRIPPGAENTKRGKRANKNGKKQ